MRILYIIILCLTVFPLEGQNKFSLIEYKKIVDNRIGMVQGIDLDSKGNIYVGDLLNKKILKYSNDGIFLEEIGRRGGGPGEFRSVLGLKIWKDTLFVFDLEQKKITAFSVSDKSKLSYEIQLPLHPDGLVPVILGNERKGLDGIWIVDDKNLLVIYGKYSSLENLDEKKTIEGYIISRKGTFQSLNPVFKLFDREMIVFKTGKSFATGPLPYGKVGMINTDKNGNIFYLNNDSKIITKLNPSTGNTQKINYNTPRIFVNSVIEKTLLNEQPDEIVKLM